MAYVPAPAPGQPMSVTIQLDNRNPPPQTYAVPQQPHPYSYPPGQPIPYGYVPPPGYMAPPPGYLPPGGYYPPNVVQPVYYPPGQLPPPAAAAPAAAPAAAKEEKKPAPIDMKEIKAGTIKVIVHAGNNLYDTQCIFRQDPYVRMTVGGEITQTEHISGGGIRPTWNNPSFYFGISHSSGSLRVEAIAWNYFCDSEIGTCDIPIENIISQTFAEPAENKKTFSLTRDGSVRAGDLSLTLRYLPPLTVTVHEGRNLYDAQVFGKQDPYVVLTYKGQSALNQAAPKKTKTHDDGGVNPRWEETFSFNTTDDYSATATVDKKELEVKDEPKLSLQIMDENVVVDKAIGYIDIPRSKLLEVRATKKPVGFKVIKGDASDKGNEYAGEIFISVQ